MQKRQHQKSCEIKGGGPEVAKNLITAFQANLLPLEIGSKIHLKCCY